MGRGKENLTYPNPKVSRTPCCTSTEISLCARAPHRECVFITSHVITVGDLANDSEVVAAVAASSSPHLHMWALLVPPLRWAPGRC